MKLVSSRKVGFNPNLLIKRSLVPRLNMEPNNRMDTSNPKGKINLPRIKIINSRRPLLIKIISNPMLLLQVSMVTNGALGVDPESTIQLWI